MSTLMVTVLVLSIVLGFVNQAIQAGTAPKPWLPELTMFGTFLAGVVASLSSSPVLSAASVEQALLYGLLALSGGAAPGIARFAHTVVPMHVRDIRARAAEALKKAA